MYGMSEHSVVELANNLRRRHEKAQDACVGVRGTAYMAHDAEGLAWDAVELPVLRGCLREQAGLCPFG